MKGRRQLSWASLALLPLLTGGLACGYGEGAVPPLPDGLAVVDQVDNAAALRLTASGLAFMQEQQTALADILLDSQSASHRGVLELPVGPTTLSGLGYDLEVCPDGPDLAQGKCAAAIDLGHMQLAIRSAQPRHLVLAGSVPVRVSRLRTVGSVLFLVPLDLEVAVSAGGNADCDPATMALQDLGLEVQIAIEVETDPAHAARLGYSRLVVSDLRLASDDLTSGFHACGGGLDDAALNALKGILIPLLIQTIDSGLRGAVNEQVCQRADPEAVPPCPTGSRAIDEICRYDDDACVSSALGVEGHLRLAELAPLLLIDGDAAIDVALALGGLPPRADDPARRLGDLDPAAGGVTLAAFGGAVPRPASSCVTPVPLPPLEPVALPGELYGNALAGWTGDGPHLALALSEQFVNRALAAAYNSGLFCITVSGQQIPELSTELLGLLLPSLKCLSFPRAAAPALIALRPQAPPQVAFENDVAADGPLLRLRLERATFDLYVWVNERYLRALTARFDLEIALALESSAAGLSVAARAIAVRGTEVDNASLLREQPESVAAALTYLIEYGVERGLRDLDPIDPRQLTAAFGASVSIGHYRLATLTGGGQAFVALFASLRTGEPEPVPEPEPAPAATGCRAPDSAPTSTAGALLALALVALLTARPGVRPRRRRWPWPWCGVPLLLALGTGQGCNCLDRVSLVETPYQPRPHDRPRVCGIGAALPCIALKPGVIGSYPSAATDGSGALWVAGYNEADWQQTRPFGDLVVGRYDGATARVDWRSVDGVPTEPAADASVYDLGSWRGGQDRPGDDVGRWSSLTIDARGQPAVAYYDATHRALKYAAYDGASWSVHHLFAQPDCDAGRYGRMLLVAGKPVVAFQAIDFGDRGFPRSRVVLGRASVAAPASAEDWQFEDVAVDAETPCRPWLCAAGQRCLQRTLQCAAVSTSCAPACTGGDACVDGGCEPTLPASLRETHPTAIGVDLALAPSGSGEPAIVFFDAIHGSLVQARSAGGAWQNRVLDDGARRAEQFAGAGASLLVDADGSWHVAYLAGGLLPRVQYLLVLLGEDPQPGEVIDDGVGIGGQSFADGRHLLAGATDIALTAQRVVLVVYQDATVGALRLARGTPPASGLDHDWQIRAVQQPGSGGFFPRFLAIEPELRVLNFWRSGGPVLSGDVRLLSISP
ncbi:MAG: hypothetical protein JXR83_21695 [Deltaproteobacteria bacterium]|nr:hypothetical protein [Deltaproteobacteria bacterium]